MITHSNSYIILKNQTESSMNFAYLCCKAMPTLNYCINLVKESKEGKIKLIKDDKEIELKLPKADYFKTEHSVEKLKEYKTYYRKNLAKLIFINSFSYFESYFKDLIKELLNFHGGKEQFIKTSKYKELQHLKCEENIDLKKAINKLREYASKPVKKEKYSTGKKEKYSKYIEELDNTSFRFPSELFATFGIIRLGEYIENKYLYNASKILDIAQDCFGVELSKEEISKFNTYRDFRNDVAHGKVLPPEKELQNGRNIEDINFKDFEFKHAQEANKFFKTLALKIDKHVVKHFFVIEDSQVAPLKCNKKVDTTKDLQRKIKAQAAKEGISLNELTERLFNEYLNEQEQ